MKFLVLLFICLSFGCQSTAKKEFIYSPHKKALLRELNLKPDTLDSEIEKSLEAYFQRFCPSLQYIYQNGKLELIGSKKDIKAFEYVYITMFEENPDISVKFDLKSDKLNTHISETIDVVPYESKTLKNKRPDSPLKIEIECRDSLRFIDFVQFDFKILYGLKNREKALNFSAVFDNGEKEDFYFDLLSIFPRLEVDFEGEIEVNWDYKNSYFFDTLANPISHGQGREIAVMPILNGDSLEETIRGFEEGKEANKPIDFIFKKYLKAFGINLKPSDVLIYNKNTYNILLYSSKENCSMFKDIMRPLCIHDKREVKVEGELKQGQTEIAKFKLPMVMQYYTDFKSFFTELEDTEEEESESFGLELFYNSDLLTDEIFVDANLSYEYLDKKNDVFSDHSIKQQLYQSKKNILDFKSGYKLYFNKVEYKRYE